MFIKVDLFLSPATHVSMVIVPLYPGSEISPGRGRENTVVRKASTLKGHPTSPTWC